MAQRPRQKLRRGWTTGACATAAAKSAYTALLTGKFLDPVEIVLPKGEKPAFSLTREGVTATGAFAAITKDAGDDPDITHGAIIRVDVAHGSPGSGVVYRAGCGVGIITLEGLPLAVGEAAINPGPRKMIAEAVSCVAKKNGGSGDVIITISVEGGRDLATKTWNPRLGIIGGLSILGTTGVVIPYSCAAWIESIHRGIDVSRALGLTVIAGCTGKMSEERTQALFRLPSHAMIDMGDFVGGLLKYLRTHPVPQVILSGGFAKITKLANGNLDLHSGRSQVDFFWLADLARKLGASRSVYDKIQRSNTAALALSVAQSNNISLATEIAKEAQRVARYTVRKAEIKIEVLIFDRDGKLVGSSNE